MVESYWKHVAISEVITVHERDEGNAAREGRREEGVRENVTKV